MLRKQSSSVITSLNTISFGLNSLSDIDPLESNDNGINVVEEVSADSSHEIDNIRARYALKSVIGEFENPDVETLSTAHELFMHNKKTGYGFLRTLIDL